MNSAQMKLSLIKVNYGSLNEGKEQLISTFQSFDTCIFTMTEHQIVIHRLDEDITLPLTYVDDNDPFFDTYTSIYLGEYCRILRIKEKMRSTLGNTITFASPNGQGFAIHYNIN